MEYLSWYLGSCTSGEGYYWNLVFRIGNSDGVPSRVRLHDPTQGKAVVAEQVMENLEEEEQRSTFWNGGEENLNHDVHGSMCQEKHGLSHEGF